MTDWIEYNEDNNSIKLEEESYLCRLEYPDGRVLYRVKRFNIYGVEYKRGYFTTNGKKYKVTHYQTIKNI